MILITCLSIVLVISIIFGYFQYKARIRHLRSLLNILFKILTALDIMRRIDHTGAFESHDMVGNTFLLLVLTLLELRNYFVGIIVDELSLKKETE